MLDGPTDSVPVHQALNSQGLPPPPPPPQETRYPYRRCFVFASHPELARPELESMPEVVRHEARALQARSLRDAEHDSETVILLAEALVPWRRLEGKGELLPFLDRQWELDVHCSLALPLVSMAVLEDHCSGADPVDVELHTEQLFVERLHSEPAGWSRSHRQRCQMQRNGLRYRLGVVRQEARLVFLAVAGNLAELSWLRWKQWSLDG